MLVLSRKKGESIIIQDEIEITVLSVEGDNIRIGIKAPKDIEIFRKEVYLAIEEANRESAAQQVDQIEALMRRYREPK
ncbi:carbon storage regulator CsrA [Paenibacillus taichungensis]|uniref:carbon storage regulator CsrA n=1 Tax=Paenibacillus taichungensis TaxID=484184 RepID=UPI002871E5E9|nr:carbon storage regulator CsrA [Paenibacillus taichungensis]MDR9749533.1 carbon storage regulator CsrA [Paenibacillus taichungensis]